MNFFSLHSHTTYSFLDGLGQPKQYIARLDEIGQQGMAITDHGNIYSHHPFSNAFKKANKHLVYGVELYCVEKLVNERGYYHLTVIAKTNEGYQNLLKLMNLAYSEGHFYYKPRVSFAEVLQYSKGLIILSGCCCDSYLIKQEDQIKVNKFIMDFKQTEFYIELQPFIDEKLKWDKLIELSKKHNINCLVTLDSHYVKKEDKNCHDFQLAINTRKPLSDPDRLKMEYPLYLATENEVVERCKLMGGYDTKWIEDTFKVALSCNVSLPKTEMLKLGITIDQIREKCLVKMQKYGLDTKPEYMSRLEYELVLINDKGFNDYFWIIQDMMSWARERMLVGAGRGSSAGSLVCWMLGITEVDPIKNELYFERFLDVERKDAPDIDLDFPTSSREQIIEYVRQKYGYEKTSQMITFSTFAPRGVIQDSARVLGIPIWETKIATEQIVERFSGDERAELCLLDSVHGYEKLKSLYEKYPKLYESIPLEGQVKQIGKHAAGLILGNVDLKTIGFVNREGVFSIDKHHIENVGLLKIDVLGIETLDIIQDVCKEVGFDFNNLYTINLEDPIVYEKVFAAGKVLGIFQFEGTAVKNVNRSLRPRCFNHLVHIIALARPGSLHSGQTAKYIERFKGEYYEIDKNLKPYTADTLGILIFQEQIMAIVRNIGNFSWEDTGKIRRAISKNAGEEYMMSFLGKFVEGSKRLGIEKEKAEQLYKSISSFGSYSFNKSHAVSYAILSFWVAFLKAYFPEQFYARILKNEIDEQRIKSVLKEYGKIIIPWDINRSEKYFTSAIDDRTGEPVLIGGLTNIKGIGDKTADKIINSRPFSSYEDFKKRMSKGAVKHFDSAVKYDIVTTLYDTYKDKIQTMKLSRPIVSCEEILEKGRDGEEFIMLAKVIGVNPKDHNEAEKVVKRGYKMKAPTEFVVLKIIDNSDNIYIVCFDRFFTEKHKQELLSFKEKTCLFRVKKSGEGMMIGVKFKVLD